MCYRNKGEGQKQWVRKRKEETMCKLCHAFYYFHSSSPLRWVFIEIRNFLADLMLSGCPERNRELTWGTPSKRLGPADEDAKLNLWSTELSFTIVFSMHRAFVKWNRVHWKWVVFDWFFYFCRFKNCGNHCTKLSNLESRTKMNFWLL